MPTDEKIRPVAWPSVQPKLMDSQPRLRSERRLGGLMVRKPASSYARPVDPNRLCPLDPPRLSPRLAPNSNSLASSSSLPEESAVAHLLGSTQTERGRPAQPPASLGATSRAVPSGLLRLTVTP